MTPLRGKLPPALLTLRGEADARWRGMAARERLLVSVVAVVLGTWLVWSIAIAPAWTTLKRAPAQIEALDLQLQTMQRLAAEAKELRGASPVPAAQAFDALKSATDRLGERARMSNQGDRVTLTLAGVSGEQLRAWLSEARSGARARPVESQLTRGPKGYTGTLTVSVGSNP